MGLTGPCINVWAGQEVILELRNKSGAWHMLSFELLQTLSAMAELLKLKSMVLGAASGAGEGRSWISMQSRTRFAWSEVEKGEGRRGRRPPLL